MGFVLDCRRQFEEKYSEVPTDEVVESVEHEVVLFYAHGNVHCFKDSSCWHRYVYFKVVHSIIQIYHFEVILVRMVRTKGDQVIFVRRRL